MAGSAKDLIICAVDINGDINVAIFDDSKALHERDDYAFIENVIYPFDYFSAIQTLNREQYRELMGDLS